MADDNTSQLGKFGHFLSDVFGSAVGDVIAKPVIDAIFPQGLRDRQSQIATLVFGPSNKDEQYFNGSLFGGEFVKAAEERKLDPSVVIENLLARLGEMETELQDAFRDKVIQMKEGKDAGVDLEKTARVLLGIALMSDPAWKNYRKINNLTLGSLPFDPKKQCIRLEKELEEVQNRSVKLTWWQRFNFLSMTAPK